VAVRKLYNTKTPITIADILNDRTLTLFDSYSVPVLRMLTERNRVLRK